MSMPISTIPVSRALRALLDKLLSVFRGVPSVELFSGLLFESLLELFEGVKYLEFKKYIEEIIEWKKVEIKREKKSDFVDNF